MELMDYLRRLFGRTNRENGCVKEEFGTGKFVTRSGYRGELTDPTRFEEKDSRAAQLEQRIEELAARRLDRRQRRAVHHG